VTSGGEFERVYTVVDFYDGPRRGIADFHGKPHLYESESEYCGEEYRLSAVTPAILQAALEDWAIWCRWDLAFHEGRASLSTHPALPEDRARYDELAAFLQANLRLDPASTVRARGEFEGVEREAPRDVGMSGLGVRWSPIAKTGGRGPGPP